ncbi:hypothetical protein GW756_02645 [bacterium]|nr:hypothetical protein [bacterium]NCQ55885.1 hypothetical protein [Candidatus Parcubacteria bacterium]NCS67593.1 hypothetical protein [Candidatus Peregrinibacteria bacterium]NCS96242.1 hypothetical protein [bacterium]
MQPSKYRLLAEAESAGVATPATLFLEKNVLENENYAELLNKFIDQNESAFYIVRSCVSGEDAVDVSMAGHFESSGRIKPEQLETAVADYFKKNNLIQKKILPNGEVNLMVQTFMTAELGGVLFSRWKYFPGHFVGEVSTGGAEASVEGVDSSFFLLGKNSEATDTLSPEKIPTEALKSLVVKL